jgi:hypothetical protein
LPAARVPRTRYLSRRVGNAAPPSPLKTAGGGIIRCPTPNRLSGPPQSLLSTLALTCPVAAAFNVASVSSLIEDSSSFVASRQLDAGLGLLLAHGAALAGRFTGPDLESCPCRRPCNLPRYLTPELHRRCAKKRPIPAPEPGNGHVPNGVSILGRDSGRRLQHNSATGLAADVVLLQIARRQ